MLEATCTSYLEEIAELEEGVKVRALAFGPTLLRPTLYRPTLLRLLEEGAKVRAHVQTQAVLAQAVSAQAGLP